MKVVNTKTGNDVTSLYVQYMEGNITKEEFESQADLTGTKTKRNN